MTTATAHDAVASIRLCRTDEIPLGLGRTFDVGGIPVAVFRTRADTFHATDNACPHAGAPLADGILADNCVVCPFHGYRFKLDSGECENSGPSGIAIYPLVVRDGWISMNLPIARVAS